MRIIETLAPGDILPGTMLEPVTQELRPHVDTLLRRVEEARGREAVSEHKALLRAHPSSSGLIERVEVSEGEVTGYAVAARHPLPDSHPDRPSGPAAVEPPTDEHGMGRRRAPEHRAPAHWAVEIATLRPERVPDLARAMVEAVKTVEPGAEVRVWALDDADAEALRRAGWEDLREVMRLERELPIEPVPPLPEGFGVRSFRPGADEERWLALHRRVFAEHPEQAGMTREELDARIEAEWFDPGGFLLAERDGVPAGYCWTKVHPDGTGEIYIIGVAPEHQEHGLGTTLVLHGLDRLAAQGARRASLWVEGSNTGALRFYGRLGFEPTEVRRQFALR